MRPLLFSCLLSAITLGASAPGNAQFAGTDRVVGWTNAPLIPSSGSIDFQDVDRSCQPASKLCSPVLLHHGALWAGGTAYDPRHQAVWVSDGRSMQEWTVGGCKVICTVKPSIMNSKAIVTGLAIADTRQFLYHLESTEGYLGILPWNNAKCPPVPTKGGCTMQLGPKEVAGGLAYDEVRDLLYYTSSRPATVGWDNTLYVAQVAGNRCRPVCKLRLNPCLRTPFLVTGLAYDACSRRLYVAQGKDTLIVEMVDPLKCQVKQLSPCCPKQLGSAWGGLAVIPGWQKQVFGKSCLPKGCPFCSGMTAGLVGDPSLGNQAFGFQLANGPAERYAFLLLGGGRCTKGWTLPFVCGALYPTLAPSIVSPVVKIQGKGVCQGTAFLPLPIPVGAGFCGVVLCAQWLVICPPMLGRTEALQFNLTGS